MTIQPNTDDAQTWRDLAGQLTPPQIQDLDYWERATPGDCREYLLAEARDYIAGNERDAELSARIQPPAGVTRVWGWDGIDKKTNRPIRAIHWFAHSVGAAAVYVDGWQDDTGAVDGPNLSVYGLEGNQITADDARRLAAALVEAADARESLR